MKRREFLIASGLATLPLIKPQLVFGNSHGTNNKDVLVCVYQRGAADGLNMVVPYADDDYYNKRPTIAVPKPGQENGALDLDGFFGLNPNMSALMPIFNNGDLAMVHAVGSPDSSRSHFTAQDYMELGTPGINSTVDGWLNRYLETLSEQASTFQAVGFGQVQLALKGIAPAIGMNSIESFSLVTKEGQEDVVQQAIQSLFNQNLAIDNVSSGVIAAVEELDISDPASIPIENGAEYPNTSFGSDMQQLAQLIKAGIGLEVACVDIHGWDHHDQEVQAMTAISADFANSLAAFYTDLGDTMANVSVVTMTEFGRRVQENASQGTDHGHGGSMFLMGGGVNGGQVITDWPGLANNQLSDGDLAITTDYRTVLSDVLINRLSANDLSSVFPGFNGPFNASIFSEINY